MTIVPGGAILEGVMAVGVFQLVRVGVIVPEVLQYQLLCSAKDLALRLYSRQLQ